MKTKFLPVVLFIMAGVIVTVSCHKDKEITPQPDLNMYFPIVKTIIQTNCLSCHSSYGSWTGSPVAFDSDSAISEQYASIKSSVADPVTFLNKRMPQGGMLSPNDVDIIVKWFNKGGKTTD